MKYDKTYRTIIERANKPFPVDISNLYSPKEKLEKTVGQLNNKEYSRNKGKPIKVSRMGRNKYYIIDGNHRALEAYIDGHKTINAEIDEYLPNMKKSSKDYDDIMNNAGQLLDYANQIEREIDENKIPKAVPRYLYHATYKQMLPTLKKNGLEAGAFLSTSYKEAYSNAEMLENMDQDWKDNIVVFKINTGKLDKDKMFVDSKDDPKIYEYQDTVSYDVMVKNS